MNNVICIVGAGFSGAVLAQKLALSGFTIDIFDSRYHLAGNCYTDRCSITDIMVHKYGPHIFHTDNLEVWSYINQFADFYPYVNRVKTTVGNRVYSLPINLHTINQFFDLALTPSEAEIFVQQQGDSSIDMPSSFEEQALKYVGRDLYEAFFRGYTKKQWGLEPSKLPASILKRLPVRFNYDDNYFNHTYQGMPKDGYTAIVEKLLDHKNISVHLNAKFSPKDRRGYKHTFYTGPIDEWFEHKEGSLGYRTLDFEKIIDQGDYIGTAVMNFGDESTPYTRISEHKYFSPWEKHTKTIVFKEFSRQCGKGDIPYYPIRLLGEQGALKKYVSMAKREKGVSFIGRLATYRYLDMDVTIAEALHAANTSLDYFSKDIAPPAFFVEST